MRRMKSDSLVVAVAVGMTLWLSSAAFGQAIMINFDQDTSGNAIAAGTVINTAYSSMGIVLTQVGGGESKVYANANQPPGFGSPPNVVSIYGAGIMSDFNEARGKIRATFSSPASSACIAFCPNDASAVGVIRAYDSAGGLLAEKLGAAGVTGEICVSAFRISRVEFSAVGATNGGRFDNLLVTYQAGPVTGPYYLPAAANQPGTGGTAWRTNVEIVNRGTSGASYTVELLKWNQANATPVSKTYSLAAGHAVRYTNVLSSMFSYTGAATLRITGTGGNIVPNARTYNDTPSGTYGQYIGAQLLEDGVQPGETQHLLHLSQSSSDSSGFRTNLGLVSACPTQIVVEARFYGTTGGLLGTKTYTLRPYESTQINKVLLTVVPGGVSDAYIALSSATPGALFFGYASLVDNRTGDGIHIPAR